MNGRQMNRFKEGRLQLTDISVRLEPLIVLPERALKQILSWSLTMVIKLKGWASSALKLDCHNQTSIRIDPRILGPYEELYKVRLWNLHRIRSFWRFFQTESGCLTERQVFHLASIHNLARFHKLRPQEPSKICTHLPWFLPLNSRNCVGDTWNLVNIFGCFNMEHIKRWGETRLLSFNQLIIY